MLALPDTMYTNRATVRRPRPAAQDDGIIRAGAAALPAPTPPPEPPVALGPVPAIRHPLPASVESGRVSAERTISPQRWRVYLRGGEALPDDVLEFDDGVEMRVVALRREAGGLIGLECEGYAK